MEDGGDVFKARSGSADLISAHVPLARTQSYGPV